MLAWGWRCNLYRRHRSFSREGSQTLTCLGLVASHCNARFCSLISVLISNMSLMSVICIKSTSNFTSFHSAYWMGVGLKRCQSFGVIRAPLGCCHVLLDSHTQLTLVIRQFNKVLYSIASLIICFSFHHSHPKSISFFSTISHSPDEIIGITLWSHRPTWCHTPRAIALNP